jgi:GH24 family phage-related lysozyme (muramidase)
MITKKLGDEIFAWNPDAFAGKGYWFVLGKKGGFGRAASKKEMASLGKPKKDTQETKESDILKEKRNDIDKQLKVFEERGYVIPPEQREEFNKKAEPVKKTPKRRTPLSNVTAKNKPLSLDSSDNLKLKFSGSTPEPVKKGDSIADALGKVFTLIKTKNEYNQKNKELQNNFKEEKESEQQKRHDEIISAITGGKPKGTEALKKTKATKERKKEKKPSVLKKIAKKAAKPALMVAGGLMLAKKPTGPAAVEQPVPGARPSEAPTPSEEKVVPAKVEQPKPGKAPAPPPEEKVTPAKVEQPKPGKAPAPPPEEKVTPAKVEQPKPTAEKVGTPKTSDDTKKMIIRHEGAVPYPYRDSKGLWTIGVGHLIGDGKTLPPEYDAWKNNGAVGAKGNNTTPALTQEQMNKLFEEDYKKHEKIAEKGPGFDKANEPAQGAFIDLTYNMGAWWTIFKNAAKSAAVGDFDKTGDELKDSKWYTQVGNRAKEVVGLIKQGKDEESVKSQKLPTPSSSAPTSVASSAPTSPSVPSGTTGSGGGTVTSQDELIKAGYKLKKGDVQADNSPVASKLLSIAKSVQETFPGFAYFSSFNDRFHQQKSPTSQHAKGLAIDFALNKPPTDEEGKQLVDKLKKMGADYVIDEYNHPSGKATGGHMHLQMASLDGGGSAKPFPKETSTASDVSSTPKSSNLAAASTQNKDLKDKQTQTASAPPIIVNNNNTVNHGPTNNTVAKSNPNDNVPVAFMGA